MHQKPPQTESEQFDSIVVYSDQYFNNKIRGNIVHIMAIIILKCTYNGAPKNDKNLK
jgi:hypothetical protein